MAVRAAFRVFIDIPGLYSLDAMSTPPPGTTTKTVSRRYQMNVPWEAHWSLVKSHCSGAVHKEVPRAV